MQDVWQSFVDGWAMLKRNWILLWFPLLVGLGIAMMLAIVLVGMVLGTGLPANLSDLDRLEWSQAGGLIRTFSIFGVLAFLAVTAVIAGQSNMYAQASGGEQATTDQFFDGIRRMFWRFVGGNLLLTAGGFIFAVIFFGRLLQPLLFHLQSGTGLGMSDLLTWAISTTPSAIAGWVFFLIAGVLLSMWTKLIAVDDLGSVAAIVGSVRLVFSRLGPFLGLSVIGWLASGVIQRISDSGGAALLVSTVLSMIWSTYHQLVLFVFYRRITSAPPTQPEEPADFTLIQP